VTGNSLIDRTLQGSENIDKSIGKDEWIHNPRYVTSHPSVVNFQAVRATLCPIIKASQAEPSPTAWSSSGVKLFTTGEFYTFARVSHIELLLTLYNATAAQMAT